MLLSIIRTTCVQQTLRIREIWHSYGGVYKVLRIIHTLFQFLTRRNPHRPSTESTSRSLCWKNIFCLQCFLHYSYTRKAHNNPCQMRHFHRDMRIPGLWVDATACDVEGRRIYSKYTVSYRWQRVVLRYWSDCLSSDSVHRVTFNLVLFRSRLCFRLQVKQRPSYLTHSERAILSHWAPQYSELLQTYNKIRAISAFRRDV
jgi:hypothetical protein